MFKTLFVFLLSVFINNKEEIDIRSSKFNPLKVIVILAFNASIMLNVYLVVRVNNTIEKLELICPAFKQQMKISMDKFLSE